MLKWRLTPGDVEFLIKVLIPDRVGDAKIAAQIQEDEQLLEAMLDDERIFRRLTQDQDILVHVSPWLFFTVLLRRARREMEHESFTLEQRNRQQVVLFDTEQIVELLSRKPIRDYLAMLLASFTRIQSVTVPVQVRKGLWRRYRTTDIDVEGLLRYAQTLDEPLRFESYKRIADVALFLTGMFPEYLDAQHRYPLSGKVRPLARARVFASRQDYETHGQTFYRLAASHERAKREGLEEVLAALSDNFILAEKPLAFLSSRYLGFARHQLFAL